MAAKDITLVQKQETFLAMTPSPLSRGEGGRVRGFMPRPAGPLTPRPLPRGEGAKGHILRGGNSVLASRMGELRLPGAAYRLLWYRYGFTR
jgi:hypothetical protein